MYPVPHCCRRLGLVLWRRRTMRTFMGWSHWYHIMSLS